MGHEFLLKKSAHAKLCRMRKRIENFGPNANLAEAFTPAQATVQFRCQAAEVAGIQKGDAVLLFTEGQEVKILKYNNPVGVMMPYAASDFRNNFSNKACPEYQLGEIASDPNPLDKTFDVELRSPWGSSAPKS